MPTKKERQQIVANHFNFKDIKFLFVDLYDKKKMSCNDISNYILKETGVTYSAQYIRNVVKIYGYIRSRTQAYENMKIGNGEYKSPIVKIMNDKPITFSKRFRIMQKNHFVCACCGTKENINLYRINKDYPYGKNNDFNLTSACGKCAVEKNYIITEDNEADEVVKRIMDNPQIAVSKQITINTTNI